MRKVQKEEIQRVIVKREARSYKGDFGRLLLIGGTLWGSHHYGSDRCGS